MQALKNLKLTQMLSNQGGTITKNGRPWKKINVTTVYTSTFNIVI